MVKVSVTLPLAKSAASGVYMAFKFVMLSNTPPPVVLHEAEEAAPPKVPFKNT